MVRTSQEDGSTYPGWGLWLRWVSFPPLLMYLVLEHKNSHLIENIRLRYNEKTSRSMVGAMRSPSICIEMYKTKSDERVLVLCNPNHLASQALATVGVICMNWPLVLIAISPQPTRRTWDIVITLGLTPHTLHHPTGIINFSFWTQLWINITDSRERYQADESWSN